MAYAGVVAGLTIPLILVLWRNWVYAGLLGFLIVYSYALADLLGLVTSVFSSLASGFLSSVLTVLLYSWSMNRGFLSRLVTGVLIGLSGLAVYTANTAQYLIGGPEPYVGVVYGAAFAGSYVAGGPVGGWIIGLLLVMGLGVVAGGFAVLAVVVTPLVYLVVSSAEGVLPRIKRADAWSLVIAPLVLGFLWPGLLRGVVDVASLAFFNFTPAVVYLVTGRMVLATASIGVSSVLAIVLWNILGVWGFGVAALLVAGAIVLKSYGLRTSRLVFLTISLLLAIYSISVVVPETVAWRGVVGVSEVVDVAGVNCTLTEPGVMPLGGSVRIDLGLEGCGTRFKFNVGVMGSLGSSTSMAFVGDCIVFFEALPTPSLEARVLGLVLLGLEFNASGTGVELLYRGVCGLNSVVMAVASILSVGMLSVIPVSKVFEELKRIRVSALWRR